MNYEKLGSVTPAFFAEENKAVYKKSKIHLIWEKEGGYLFQANCLDLMDAISLKHPEGCFDMIFADPPYFLSNNGVTCQNGKMASVNKGIWDQSGGVEADHAFHLLWLEKCHQLLKPNGTIWVSGTMHAIHSIGFAMQKIGYKLLNEITWEKPNPPPNLSCRYFTHSTETIIWAAKNLKSKHCFNYEIMKMQNDNKQMKSIWNFKPPAALEKKFGKHTAQKPLALLNRIIEASTKPGDFIFDPFCGSGTTGVAAMRLNRNFCGVELDFEYSKIASMRLTALNERA